MVSFELGKEIEEDVSLLVTSVGQGNDSESPWGVEHASRILLELRIFSLFHAREKTKTSISISLSSSKLTICHILFYKYDATDIADLSSLLNACHIDFVIDLTHRSCCCSVVEHRSTKSEDLMFDSSLELRIFFFVPRSWQDEKHLSLDLSASLSLQQACRWAWMTI